MTETPDEPAELAALTPEAQLDTPVALVAFPPGAPAGAGAAVLSVVGLKLGLLLFLHHVCIGSWMVTLSSYVSANSGTSGTGMFAAGFVGLAYGAGPLGGMVSPFLTGLLADHWFAAERIMATLQLLCAIALCGAVAATSQAAFFLAIFAYYLCAHPSSSLATSMALHHLGRPERDFPVVRACGTVGWIFAGVLVGWLWPMATGQSIESTTVPIKISAVTSLVTALFCLTLPNTPPANKRSTRIDAPQLSAAGLAGLLRDKRFATLMVLAVAAHIPSQFYYAYSNVFFNWTGMSSPAAKMTLGQAVEVGVMLLLPALLLRISVKAAVVAGLGVWTARFAMMAVASPPEAPGRQWLLYLSILLHGVAFTLVTISLQLDVDRCAGHGRRATAQGLFSVAVQGFGCFAGAQLAGVAGTIWLPVAATQATPAGWASFWWASAAGAAAAATLAALMMPGRGAKSGQRDAP